MPIWSLRLISALGLVFFTFIAWLLSSHKRIIPWRVILWGVGLQFAFALFILKTPVGVAIFEGLGKGVEALLRFSDEGAKFVFGENFTEHFFAFSVLPTIIFFSSLMSVLYYLGVMQKIVEFFAWLMRITMGTSGAESLSVSGNIFVGQTEAPLMIRPYLPTLTTSELMAVMTGGFATVAGGVMAAYVGMLHQEVPGIAGHLITASVLSAPAALVMAKVMIPETQESVTRGKVKIHVPKPGVNVIDAAARGAADGVKLALNVAGMLIAFIALIALVNGLLAWGTSGLNWVLGHFGWQITHTPTLQEILGWVFTPFTFFMGVPPSDIFQVSQLVGIKTVINEFVAYQQLTVVMKAGLLHETRSAIIASYALCGFANFSSIAIQIGGIGPLIPDRMSELARLGLRAMIAGTLAAFMTASMAGILL